MSVAGVNGSGVGSGDGSGGDGSGVGSGDGSGDGSGGVGDSGGISGEEPGDDPIDGSCDGAGVLSSSGDVVCKKSTALADKAMSRITETTVIISFLCFRDIFALPANRTA